MLYAAGRTPASPIGFELFDDTAVDADLIRQKLQAFHAGQPVHLDGGTEIGRMRFDEAQTQTLRDGIAEIGAYGILAMPGSMRQSVMGQRRFDSLPPRAQRLVLATHATFRHMVRLDAERNQLQPPNRAVGRTEAGMFSKGIGWHSDDSTFFPTEAERRASLEGHGILRYTVSVLKPGTDIAYGTLHPEDIVDMFTMHPDLEIGEPDSRLQIATHAAATVVRFVSDYDVHRTHPLPEGTSAPGYFDTASVVLPQY